MESWSYASEEKSYLFSDEMDFPLDAYMRSRRPMVEWDNKASYIFEKDGFVSDKEVIKSVEFVDLGFPDLFRRPVHGSQPPEASNCEHDSDSSKKINSSTHVIALNSPLGEVESESRHSCSLVEPKIHDSSLIDLKLGRVGDCKDASSDKNDNEGFAFQPMYPSTLTKRARTSSLPTQTPVCQVYGCSKDLSSSKEYHKRHRVCDAHSKTAKVIVNGIEQRFCQQCSRFHLLAEFDEGRRSCRRRLAGHNQRRRKPQFDYVSGKPCKMLQLHQGTKNLEASFQKRPQFASQDMISCGILYDQTDLSVTPTQEKLSTPSYATCALSLLSVQSQNPSCLSAGNPGPSSCARHAICTNHSDEKDSKVHLGINPADKYVQNESSSHGLSSMEATKKGSILLSDADCAHHLQVCKDHKYQTSELLDATHYVSPEDGATVDLLQLSSHLQRVEHQRKSFIQRGL